MSILLLRYAKSRLLLNIDGDVKEFFDNDDKTMSKAFPDNLTYETEDVTNSFSSYLAIIGIDGSCFRETKRYVKKLSVTFTKISCF